MTRVPMTEAGASRLRTELEQLKSVTRPRIIEAIAEARAHGDLKENAEYHAARDQQSFTEGRIKLLESALSNAEVIDVARLTPGSRVVFGTTVDLIADDSDEQVTYKIVGDLEADIKLGMISISSPVARALVGRFEGDTVTIATPGGAREYEISRVRYVV